MKISKLIKIIPFLSILLLISFIGISNQKQNTKLKILIWNTPSLSVGTYLAIASGSGFLISYLITLNLVKDRQSNTLKTQHDIISSDDRNYNYEDENTENENIYTYQNTLIERDFNEPSPTINASFRVISKNNRSYDSNKAYENHEDDISTYSNEFQDQFSKQDITFRNEKEDMKLLNDWNDYTYLNW